MLLLYGRQSGELAPAFGVVGEICIEEISEGGDRACRLDVHSLVLGYASPKGKKRSSVYAAYSGDRI